MSIEDKRRKNNMTQVQLAEELGVSQSTVAGWETGGVYPRVDKLLAMAKLFNCTVDELIVAEKE